MMILFRMPRPTIFSKMGFRPDPKFAHSQLMSTKRPFFNRVRNKHDIALKRYAQFNFPLNNKETADVKDEDNPNLLNSVRLMSSNERRNTGDY